MSSFQKEKHKWPLTVKIFSIPRDQRNPYLNYFELAPYSSKNDCHQEVWQQMLGGCEKEQPFLTVGGSAN